MARFSPIAVVGMAGIFPDAPDLDSFWKNISEKRSAIAEVPSERWIIPPPLAIAESYEMDKAISKRAGLIDAFEPDINGLALDAALFEALDPMHHLALKAAKDAYDQIKYGSSDPLLKKARTGVVLAAIALPTDQASKLSRELSETKIRNSLFGHLPQFSPSDFHLDQNGALSARVTSFPAALIAQALELGGGSFTLDAACSSSLFAVKLACDTLHAGQADVMLAGGVSRPDCLYTQIGFSQLRALSPTGRCAPFDKSADGLVVGEGAGVLALKRLEDAIGDKDHVYGVIRGIGLSNDIGGGLLAPLSEGQIRAMRCAYKSAKWSPQDVQLIECHGAGTPVGDMTELTSLCKLWDNTNNCQCAIGSIKSMIGHLLTAAGVAGMIKVLLGMQHGMLPPSLNFTEASPESPLANSPFHVQTEVTPWHAANQSTPRRAAISAFGFGGTNAHLLLEEWSPPTTPIVECLSLSSSIPDDDPVAIVGMATHIGEMETLTAFQTSVFNGHASLKPVPTARWCGYDDMAKKVLGTKGFFGAFIDSLELERGAYQIPPNELSDIIPQHLLMLQVAVAAWKDAGLILSGEHPASGAIIGMGFDPEATDFHVRWHLLKAIDGWLATYSRHFSTDVAEMGAWKKALLDSVSPPLNATRTLGALGSMVASRIAKAFRFGAPSFVVSCEEASGLKALELGLNMVQRKEADSVLIGAVDMAGDLRRVLAANTLLPLSDKAEIRPFDKQASGSLPGEGAVALVLKSLDQAEKDGDRIYSIIRKVGKATGTLSRNGFSAAAYEKSLKRCLSNQPAVSLNSVDLIETHGLGAPDIDRQEIRALQKCFGGIKENPAMNPCALGSLKPITGDVGAVSGLAAVVKTSLCLFHHILPPLGNRTTPPSDVSTDNTFFVPNFPQYWFRNQKDGLRHALVGSMTTDGNAMHLLLQEPMQSIGYGATQGVSTRIEKERLRPLGPLSHGLFLISGNTTETLLANLESLRQYIHTMDSSPPMDHLAMQWYQDRELRGDQRIAIIATDCTQLIENLDKVQNAIFQKASLRFERNGGGYYSVTPAYPLGDVAFVFPGSGNHFIGMGRDIALIWPEILWQMNLETAEFKDQTLPVLYVPQRFSWAPGWEKDAEHLLNSDPRHMIFGQVVYGDMMVRLADRFGLKPQAAIGYSLGESTGLFALNAWPDRGKMFNRMQDTSLFKTELSGPCHAMRRAWKIPEGVSSDWVVAMVNRSSEKVKPAIRNLPYVRLLIINTADECVIGGQRDAVLSAINRLACEAIFIQGVATVHCDAAQPASEAYRELHTFQTTPPSDIRFYSCAKADTYDVTSENAAGSILSQALSGFNFVDTIQKAYADGIRIFLEMGPHASCTRMITQILKDKEHLAVSTSFRGENEYVSLLKFIGTLFVENIPLDLDVLYGKGAWPECCASAADSPLSDKEPIYRSVGTILEIPPVPLAAAPTTTASVPSADNSKPVDTKPLSGTTHSKGNNHLFATLEKQVTKTSKAHQQFLDFSKDLAKTYAETFSFQTALLEKALSVGASVPNHTNSSDERTSSISNHLSEKSETQTQNVVFSRQMCMEFAIGSAATVLGPEFAIVDTYPARVRLPDEPLMLVDRILSVTGIKGKIGPGRIITEHDVLPNAWYLDGGHAPVCISVEAGQADLFLCAYLGIDLLVKGARTYRLLDATVEFYRSLPEPGDVIRYDIEIERFARHGETHLFFFHFDGYIGNEHLIQMRNGCAGFFTEEEVKNSGGILLSDTERAPVPDNNKSGWRLWVETEKAVFDKSALNALRKGDLGACFGKSFQGVSLSPSLWLPKGPMKLIDRIRKCDPTGGRFGLGVIQAEADIHPDDWFLTCHFVDDMVMPGTLMYECCAHTLRVFMQRMGIISDRPDACYEPVVGVKSRLKCRGPVTPKTHQVIYEVEIKETGFNPEPFAIADAHMYADGHRIVYFEDMSLKLSNVTEAQLESFWKRHKTSTPPKPIESPVSVVFSQEQVMAFASGKPSDAFGPPYQKFDDGRFIARLPQPPYSFIDRIIHSDHEPWDLSPGGWITAEYRAPKNAWYFVADRSRDLPYCILNEIALQACGWLAAYAGSALKSTHELRFRNLGGTATVYPHGPAEDKLFVTQARLTKVSTAGDMIIEHFDFKVYQEADLIYEGSTHFGFFTQAALSNQIGMGAPAIPNRTDAGSEENIIKNVPFQDEPPLSPFVQPDEDDVDKIVARRTLKLPSNALRMLDKIDIYLPTGGPQGLGYACGSKRVNPSEWFFTAHFYQDPVCPGSLGIESFVQLMKWVAMERWPQLISRHRFQMLSHVSHEWTYRGQITPKNKNIEVEATIISVTESPIPTLVSNGYLKVDGLYIYKMDNMGLQLIPI